MHVNKYVPCQEKNEKYQQYHLGNVKLGNHYETFALSAKFHLKEIATKSCLHNILLFGKGNK